MSTNVAKRPQGRFSEADKQRALITLAAVSGNSSQAARLLAGDGIEVAPCTLREWREKRSDEYAAIRAEILPKIREQQAELHRDLERRMAEASGETLDLLRAELPTMETKDKILFMSKSDVGSGIHGDKAQLYDGQPTAIISRSHEDLVRELEAEGVKLEAIDVEVVEEKDVSPGS